MGQNEPDFDEQDSGVPVTPPDRNPDPPGPAHSVPEGVGGGSAQGGGTPAGFAREQRAGSQGD